MQSNSSSGAPASLPTCHSAPYTRPQCWGRGHAALRFLSVRLFLSLDLINVSFFHLGFYVVFHIQLHTLPVVSISSPYM